MRSCGASAEARAGRRAAGGPATCWVAPAVAAMVLALFLSGCSQANSTRLPELATLPRGLLSKEEQKKAVDELQERREVHRTEAMKEIRSARRSEER